MLLEGPWGLVLGLTHGEITDTILISILIQINYLGCVVLVQCISRETVRSLSFLYLVLDEYFSLLFLPIESLHGILDVDRVSHGVHLVFVLGPRCIRRIRDGVIA